MAQRLGAMKSIINSKSRNKKRKAIVFERIVMLTFVVSWERYHPNHPILIVTYYLLTKAHEKMTVFISFIPFLFIYSKYFAIEDCPPFLISHTGVE